MITPERGALLAVFQARLGYTFHNLTLLNQGVGLANTRARLEHRYPNDHRLVFSNADPGFRVTVFKSSVSVRLVVAPVVLTVVVPTFQT